MPILSRSAGVHLALASVLSSSFLGNPVSPFLVVSAQLSIASSLFHLFVNNNDGGSHSTAFPLSLIFLDATFLLHQTRDHCLEPSSMSFPPSGCSVFLVNAVHYLFIPIALPFPDMTPGFSPIFFDRPEFVKSGPSHRLHLFLSTMNFGRQFNPRVTCMMCAWLPVHLATLPTFAQVPQHF